MINKKQSWWEKIFPITVIMMIGFGAIAVGWLIDKITSGDFTKALLTRHPILQQENWEVIVRDKGCLIDVLPNGTETDTNLCNSQIPTIEGKDCREEQTSCFKISECDKLNSTAEENCTVRYETPCKKTFCSACRDYNTKEEVECP